MRSFFIGLVALCFGAVPLAAQEHPKEHPQNPEKAQAKGTLTLDELAEAITGYVQHDAKLKGGFFLVYDTVDKKPLALQLDRVHKDRLATLGDGVYFACTDMKSPDGTLYDLDFFMMKTDHGIETTEVDIHKKSGVARYGWKEVEGVWKKVQD